MAKKKFVLRLEEEDYASIEKWANDEFRSVNGQIEWMLSSMLKTHKRSKVKEIAKSGDDKNETE